MKTRIVNEEVVELYDKHYSETNKPLIMLYEAPTGYGKSSIAPYIAYRIRRSGVFYGYIHVLPMRSIVSSLYNDMVERRKYPFNLIKDLEPENTGFQASGLFLSGKDPFYSRKYNVSTIDSFILNLLKLSIGEGNTYYKHYEASRSMIFTSMITLDEIHLYGGDPGSPEKTLFSSYIAMLKTLPWQKTPLLLVTATLPEKVGEYIYSVLTSIGRSIDARIVWLKYGRFTRSNNTFKLQYMDKTYDEAVDATTWKTEIIGSRLENVVGEIHDIASTSNKLLVIMNKPRRAVRVYGILVDKGYNPVLLHGRMKYSERIRNEEKIRDARIVVATQVVEAGIDVDFDTIITDIAPPTSLVQRIGRVNRRLKQDIGRVYIVVDYEGYDKVYDDGVVKSTIDFLRKNKNRLNWRKPYGDRVGTYGYGDLIDEVYAKYGIEELVEYSKTYIYSEIMYSPLLTPYNLLERFVGECIKGYGLTRSSILISLYPIEEEEIANMDPAELAREAVPVNLDWLIYNRGRLLRGSNILYLNIDRSEYVIEYEKLGEEHIGDVKRLRSIICRLLYGKPPSRKGFFIGLTTPAREYINGLGLMVL